MVGAKRGEDSRSERSSKSREDGTRTFREASSFVRHVSGIYFSSKSTNTREILARRQYICDYRFVVLWFGKDLRSKRLD